MFIGRNPSRTSKHHNVSCWFGSNLCRSKAEPPDKKNGCLGVLCRPFCLQPRYYGLPSLLKFDGPTSPGANYEKYDFSENRKVQNPPGWWVFLLTEYDHFRTRTLRYGLKINQIMYPHMVLLFSFFVLVFLLDELVRMEFNDPSLIILDKKT